MELSICFVIRKKLSICMFLETTLIHNQYICLAGITAAGYSVCKKLFKPKGQNRNRQFFDYDHHHHYEKSKCTFSPIEKNSGSNKVQRERKN